LVIILVTTIISVPKVVDSDRFTDMAIYYIEGTYDTELSGRIQIRLNEILREQTKIYSPFNSLLTSLVDHAAIIGFHHSDIIIQVHNAGHPTNPYTACTVSRRDYKTQTTPTICRHVIRGRHLDAVAVDLMAQTFRRGWFKEIREGPNGLVKAWVRLRTGERKVVVGFNEMSERPFGDRELEKVRGIIVEDW
jgi:hypothetical protein